MKLLEYFPYFVATILVGWFSPRIFTSGQWPIRHQWLFTATLTITMFVMAGVYRLHTGEDITDKIQDDIFCPIFNLSHCPGQTAEGAINSVTQPTVATQPSNTAIVGPAPVSPPPAAQQNAPATQDQLDLAYWESIRNSKSVDSFSAYLSRFPSGHFTDLAHERINEISAAIQNKRNLAAHRTNTVNEAGAANTRSESQSADTASVPNSTVAPSDKPEPTNHLCVEFNGRTICDTHQNDGANQP